MSATQNHLPHDWDTEPNAPITLHNNRENRKGQYMCENKENQLACTEESRPDRVSSGDYIVDIWERPAEVDKKMGSEKRYHCIDCGKSFTRKSSLIVHQRIHTGEKHFVCTECEKRFGLKSSLVRHLRTHTPKTLNICPECGKCFTRYSSLFQHQKVHRTEKLYKCSHCGKNFSQTSALVVHEKTHKEEKSSNKTENVEDSVPKNNADKVFYTHSSSLDRRNDNNTCKPSNNKDNCEKTCRKNGDCTRGRQQSQSSKTSYEFNSIESGTFCGEKRYHCIDCGKSFTRKSSLIVHQRIHTGEKHFICTECGKKFGLKSSLVRHLRTHIPKTLNICPDCGKCFTRYSNLFQHQKVHRREKPYTCSQHEKSFHGTSQLLAPHNGEKGPEKVESGKNVDDSMTIGNSYRMETTENPDDSTGNGARSLANNQNTLTKRDLLEQETYSGITKEETTGVCCIHSIQKEEKPECAMEKCCVEAIPSNKRTVSFWGRSELSERRILSGEKRYLCTDCGKSFTRKSSLIVHQRIHTGEKRFMCIECGKRFGLKSSLVRHLRTHTPKTLNICPECGKCFTRYSSLFQHLKVHRREKTHKCYHCEKSFSRTSQLLVHQRTHKGGKLSAKLKCETVGDRPRTNRTEQFFMCVECGMSFCEENLLTVHQNIHKANCIVPTSLKDGVSNLQSDVLEWDTVCDDKPFLVENNSTSHNSSSLNISPDSESRRPNTIGECVKRKSNKSVHSCEKQYHCNDCGKNFTRKSSLIVHQRIHTGEKRFMCTECGKRFGLKSSLVRHMRTHTGRVLNICCECGIYFSRYSDLLLHMEIHSCQTQVKSDVSVSKVEPVESQCVLNIEGSENIDKVLAAVPVLKDSEPCLLSKDQSSECEKFLKKKQQPCTAATEYMSDYLPNGYSDIGEKIGLDNEDDDSVNIKQEPPENICTDDGHLDGDKIEEFPAYPYALDWGVEFDISKSFNGEESSGKQQKSRKRKKTCGEPHLDVMLHQDFGINVWNNPPEKGTLSGEKRFLCIDCGKSFTRKSSLIVHQRIHTGEKRFMCTECGKRFGLKSSLVRHQRIHSTEFFRCIECGKSFREYSKFLHHQTSHTGEWSYTKNHLTVH